MWPIWRVPKAAVQFPFSLLRTRTTAPGIASCLRVFAIFDVSALAYAGEPAVLWAGGRTELGAGDEDAERVDGKAKLGDAIGTEDEQLAITSPAATAALAPTHRDNVRPPFVHVIALMNLPQLCRTPLTVVGLLHGVPPQRYETMVLGLLCRTVNS